jgi:hypothetical protein
MQAGFPEGRQAFLKKAAGSWVLVCSLFLPAAPAAAGTAAPDGRVIVQWAPGATHEEKVDARRRAGVGFAADLGNRKFQLVYAAGGTAASHAERLEAARSVLLAEPDAVDDTASVPNDPLFPLQWGLANSGSGIDGQTGVAGDDIDAPGAWPRTVGDPSVVVAVIDSGYRFEEPDLAGVAWTNRGEIPGNGVDDDEDGIVDDVHGADFIGANGQSPAVDGDPTDDDLLSGGHGVHTAGTIGAAGDNGVGVTGVAQNVRIMPLRVCSRFPTTQDNRCLVSAEVAAINYAAAHGVQVANLSFTAHEPSQAMVNAIAAAQGTLFVAAAGNDRNDNDGSALPPGGHHYPCDYTPQTQASPPVPGAADNVLCVAATDQTDELAPFSDWGESSVDLGAPGTEILSTYPSPAAFEDAFGTDFPSRWAATGTDGGFELSRQAPLTSYGVTDRAGPPQPKTTRESTSPAFAVPANAGCRFNQTGRIDLAPGDSYEIELVFDGTPLAPIAPARTLEPGLEQGSFSLPPAMEAGGQAQLRLRFTTGPAPQPSSGVLLDRVSITCAEPLGGAAGYGFLEGTSTAAAFVSGAAALLYSMEPSASPSLIRQVLISSVDRTESLEGKTTSGGRLNVSRAVDHFDHTPPVPPRLTGTSPPSRSDFNYPRIQGSAEEFSTVAIYATSTCGGPPVKTGPVAELESNGIEAPVANDSTNVFSATATDTAGNVSACSNSIEYVERTLFCHVPHLRGRPVAAAKRALRHASCKLGRVLRRRLHGRRHRGRSVVLGTRPRAGATPADDTVDLRVVRQRVTRARHRH